MNTHIKSLGNDLMVICYIEFVWGQRYCAIELRLCHSHVPYKKNQEVHFVCSTPLSGLVFFCVALLYFSFITQQCSFLKTWLRTMIYCAEGGGIFTPQFMFGLLPITNSKTPPFINSSRYNQQLVSTLPFSLAD